MKIILASKSARRKKILEEKGYEIEVDASGFDEKSVKKDDVKELVREIARQKAELVAERHPDSIIVAADTLVYFEGKELGQQETDEQAKETMQRLMGKTHEVVSGLCVINSATNKMLHDIDVSYVTLKRVSDEKLDEYIKSGLYKGKAGAYNIDDPEFKSFVEKVEGSYTNIMGLPIEKIEKMIQEVK